MAKDFDNTNTGVLFKNDKEGNPNWPDYKGSININGQEFWLSAWIKERKDGGGKFMSMKAKPKDAQPARQPSGRLDDMQDDVPF
jgi:hypothetical protein